MKGFILSLLLISTITFTFGQNINKIEPPHWYVGMQNPEVQLMVYGPNIQQFEPRIQNSMVLLKNIHKVENQNYLFIDLDLSKISQPENILIEWHLNQEFQFTTTYSLKERIKKTNSDYTFDSKDVIYLITPDRFANGDPSNDVVPNLLESSIDRNQEYTRHGGDIKGIIDHLDYIQEMGFTSIWINPVLENDQPQWSYHGYATTDYYKVDPRFGTNEMYVDLSRKAKEKGIGLIMDVVSNHCGNKHWWMDDLPSKDWLNYQEKQYQGTNHRKSTLLDPYVAPSDRDIMVKGWFVPTMPDLNQRNPFLAKYLIQNTIWWIEYADLYGIRQDTYSYPFKDFMTNWTCHILNEYPNFNIVGEEWTLDPSLIAYWQKGKINKDGYESCLRSVMDFPLNSILIKAFKEKETWGTGLVKLYENLGLDHLYSNPNDMLVFADNHDMDRITTSAEDSISIVKMAMTYILTTRGIPQIFYGTELLMSHIGTNSHGAIRADFPGGWQSDTSNGFNGNNIPVHKIEFQNWLKKILNWRKSNEVIHNGKMMHFSPKEGTYVYFRYNAEATIMIVFNKNNSAYELDMTRFQVRTSGFTKIRNIESNEEVEINDVLLLPVNSVQIFELHK
jgi:glycosidase